MATYDVTVRTQIEAPAERVWSTLTADASTWMGAAAESTWEPGAPITWSGTWKGREFTDEGEVIEAEAPRMLVHTHRSGQGPAHRLAWMLRADGGDTELTLVQSGAESQEQADEFEARWTAMLDRLKDAAESAA